MPPGIGDATLDIIRLVKRINFIVVTTPSRVALETVKKLLALLRELGVLVVGVIENMVMKPSDFVINQLDPLGLTHLGSISFDEELESTLGDITSLMETKFAEAVNSIASEIEQRLP